MDPRQQQPTQPQAPTEPEQPSGGGYAQPQVPTERQLVAPTEPQVSAPVSDTAQKKGVKLPIILMVWPAASLVVLLALYVLLNLAVGSSEDGLFGNASPVRMAVNILLFTVGGVAIFFGPISFIVGLVLLIIRKNK